MNIQTPLPKSHQSWEQVRNRLDRRWSSGFEVDVPTDDGYRLRRVSDNAVLPAAFPPAEIRPEE